MALIRKPGGRTNRCQGNIGRTERTTGLLDAKLTNVLSDSTMVELAEFAREMDGVNAYRSCQVSESQLFGELFVQ